jgi:hypothetical protein
MEERSLTPSQAYDAIPWLPVVNNTRYLKPAQREKP